MSKEIVLVPRGGLANRMRAIASAVALTHRLNMSLEVVWINTTDLAASFSDLFQTGALPFKLKELPGRRFSYLPHRSKYLYLPTLWQILSYNKILRDETKIGRHYLTEADPVEIESYFTAIKSGRILVDTCHQFYPFTEESYRSIFKPSKEVERHVASLPLLSGQQIGLHIRRTDNTVSIDASPTRLFEDVINNHISGNDIQQFYLATDDDETKRYLDHKFPGHISYSPTTASRSSRQGMIEGAAEMVALSRCTQIYGSFYSSYSEAASMLGDIPLKIIKN